jgi:F-type H+-transporting ATPase subunit epsilon
MAAAKTFHCSIVTPERAVLETDAATFVALPAWDGEIGFLVDRAPIICKLAAGEARVRTAEGERRWYVDGGFAEMVDNRLTVLTETTRDPEELDPGAARRALELASAMPVGDRAEESARDRALQRARAQLRLAARD